MTKKQEDILAYIHKYWSDNNTSPTYYEIAKHFEITPQAVNHHINKLHHIGKIKFNDNKFRKIII